jgi:hypothetical protein
LRAGKNREHFLATVDGTPYRFAFPKNFPVKTSGGTKVATIVTRDILNGLQVKPAQGYQIDGGQGRRLSGKNESFSVNKEGETQNMVNVTVSSERGEKPGRSPKGRKLSGGDPLDPLT